MAFEHASMNKMREIALRAQGRLASIKKASEKGLHAAFQVAEINGTLFGWGYANERWGTAPASDPSGYKEIAVMGVPADLGVGVALIGLGLFGGLGTYAEHGLNVGSASSGAFSYRMGGELGKKAGTATTTSGRAAMGAGQRATVGANGGRVHHVQYAR